MHAGVIPHASRERSPKPLVVRGGLVRTFGGLAAFLVVTFLCCGVYILADAFANPLGAGDAALIASAFIITLAAMLLFFLLKPRKRLQKTSHDRALHSAVSAALPFFDAPPGAVRQDDLRSNLAYQRFYVDHSRIRQ
jgi:hypothetical protein